MSVNDTIADMLTRIRNATRSHHPRVNCSCSNVCKGIAQVLKDEGYINDFDVIEDGKQGVLRIDLKYGDRGEDVIHAIQRVSKPSRRVYSKTADLPRPMSGLGIAIVSTSYGIFSDREARQKKIGGELLCTVE